MDEKGIKPVKKIKNNSFCIVYKKEWEKVKFWWNWHQKEKISSF